MDIQISKTTIDTLTGNIWDEKSNSDLDKAPIDRKLLVLTQFFKDPKVLVGWAEDFEHDANLSEEELPELTGEYRTAAKEMRNINSLYQSNEI